MYAGRTDRNSSKGTQGIRGTYMWLWWNSTILSSSASCWGMYLFFAKCSLSEASSKSPISATKEQRKKTQPYRINTSQPVDSPVEHSRTSKAEGSGEGDPSLWVWSGPDVNTTSCEHVSNNCANMPGWFPLFLISTSCKEDFIIHPSSSILVPGSFFPPHPTRTASVLGGKFCTCGFQDLMTSKRTPEFQDFTKATLKLLYIIITGPNPKCFLMQRKANGKYSYTHVISFGKTKQNILSFL